MRFIHGQKLLSDLLRACGFDPADPYQRLVLVCDINDVPKVYVTRVVDADAAIRVVETLKGATVDVVDPDAVQVVTLTEGSR